MQRALPLCAACAAAGAAYLLWRRRRQKTPDGPAPFCFDAPLPAHIELPSADVQAGVVVELDDEYRKQRQRHLVISSALSPAHLKALLPIIQELFVPQKVGVQCAVCGVRCAAAARGARARATC